MAGPGVSFTGGGEADLQNKSTPSTQPKSPKSMGSIPDAGGEMTGSSIGSTIPKKMANGTPDNSTSGGGLSSTVPGFGA